MFCWGKCSLSQNLIEDMGAGLREAATAKAGAQRKDESCSCRYPAAPRGCAPGSPVHYLTYYNIPLGVRRGPEGYFPHQNILLDFYLLITLSVCANDNHHFLA
jgi:hypothetical protein